KSSIYSVFNAWEYTVWCAPPAWIQAVAATSRLGFGSQSTLATGSLGKSAIGSTASTSFTINRNLLPISTNEALMALPAGELKTSRTGSSLPPIPNGCTSQDGLALAIDGQISNMWD